MTSEQLAADLYGDRGRPGAVRVEVSRLRKLLDGGIEADAYRLAIDTESDVAHVRTLLDRGQIRVAVEQYAGPLLPDSEAPGIVRDRDELEAWVRQGVMSADGPGRPVGVGPMPLRPRRPARLEASAHAARIPRPAP
jgi:hypothetical protein